MYDGFLVHESDFWKLYLHQNQYYLGRCYLWCKRNGVNDLLEMTLNEQRDFFILARALKRGINTLFYPDLINYASLGNIAPHLHIHIIPRYKTERIFYGKKFIDENWGQNYAPYPRNVVFEPNLMAFIKNNLIKTLTKMEGFCE